MTPKANTSQKRKRTPTEDKASKKQRKRKTTALKTTAPSSPDTQSHATTPPHTPTAPRSFSLETFSSNKDQAAHTRLQQQIHAETEILHVYLRSLRNQLTQTPSRDVQYEICQANAKGIAAQYAILGDLEAELEYFGRSVELHTLDEAAAIKKEKTGELLSSSIPSWAEAVAAWGQPVVDRVRRDTHSVHFCTYLGWFARRGFEWKTVANLLATAVVNRLDDSRRPSRLALLTVDAVYAKKEIPRPAPVLAAKDVLRVGCRLDRFGLLVPMSVEEREWARFL
ncbi:hypothetical protein BO86DRAFT_384883 [Aspergillus japonicus CBS 114.51]|uniref:Uncharacterized protein n=2 Tax=Aspergillus TaxID=5052 RepID=A0A2V5H3R2_ASPV1|nr:hypothetical protein BO86DRAFT_384883 [Aspergillus japonicus CBS 114.51]PYI18638.1 hypothetical protein BO99DRAFT_413252 [Aspergillus violaceofuscus CBS 115571]RAH86883.1 hypothetical protein BO86DRAFT_384883 [Aspergillus japonicus CBS 114.51]